MGWGQHHRQVSGALEVVKKVLTARRGAGGGVHLVALREVAHVTGLSTHGARWAAAVPAPKSGVERLAGSLGVSCWGSFRTRVLHVVSAEAAATVQCLIANRLGSMFGDRARLLPHVL